MAREELREEGFTFWTAIQNASSQPIYQVIVSIVPISQSGSARVGSIGFKACIGVAPPGKGYVAISEVDNSVRRLGAQIAFQDAAGRKWVRKADGELIEIHVPTTTFCEIDLPTGWQSTVPEIPEVNL